MEPMQAIKLNNFVAYELDDGTGRFRMGHYDQQGGTITPLAFESGTPIENLYQVIEVGEDNVIAAGESFAVTDELTILPPLGKRGVIAVGQNYRNHVQEVGGEIPKDPIIFTKRQTSIIANEEDILLHEGFTECLDYEGEIGVIIGKGGSQISEADAENHIWRYTIINDVSAREKQRAHKQVFIGEFTGLNVGRC